MKNNFSLLLLIVLLLTACSSEPSLQEYFVTNQEDPNFIVVDIPASILKMDQVDLTPTQKEAVSSLRKFNLLAFKVNEDNIEEFSQEQAQVSRILDNDDFTELMKINTQYGKGVVKYLGDENAIDEVIVFGHSKDKGFALVRVLGNNMNPAHLIQLIQAIQKSDYKGNELGEIGKFLKG
ncbi:DUF4252 domain-containing protein [Croceivirga radicis]|nr:DUF4252 domain-containing protein [Croceivirga radicis]